MAQLSQLAAPNSGIPTEGVPANAPVGQSIWDAQPEVIERRASGGPLELTIPIAAGQPQAKQPSLIETLGLGETEVSSWEPSWRDTITYGIADIFGGDRAAVKQSKSMLEVLDLLPVTGDIAGAVDTKDAYDAGNYWTAAGIGGLTLAGALVPAAKGATKAASKGLKRSPVSWSSPADISDDVLDEALIANRDSERTQIGSTLGTATKAKAHLDEIGGAGPLLDYGSGLGKNAEALGADTFEPFPRAGVDPKFTRPQHIPDGQYGQVISTNVLNVLPRQLRDEAVQNIGRSLRPGGRAVVQMWKPQANAERLKNSKGRFVPGEEPNSSRSVDGGQFQRGMTKAEMRDYVEETLGEGYTVTVAPGKAGISGSVVVITKKPNSLPMDEASRKGLKAADAIPAQAIPTPEAPLIAHHNIRAEGLSAAEQIGGIPMPSVAVSRADYPVTNFGDVSLIADPSIAKPSGKNPAWTGDAYTGRQPRGEFGFRDTRAAYKSMADDPIFGGLPYPSDIIERSVDFERADEAVKRIRFLVESGTIDPKKFHDIGDLDNAAHRYLEGSVPNTKGLDAYGDVDKTLPQGFTDMGNRKKPKPYTMENVLKEMKKGAAGRAGGEGFNYGSSSFRAVSQRPLKSLTELKAARSRILPEDQTKEIFEKFSDEYSKLVDEIAALNVHGRESFGTLDSASEFMNDLISGRGYEWRGVDWVDNMSDTTRLKIRELAETARELPSGYMEVKPKRAVDLSEFKAAIIPENTPAETVALLKRNGITDISQYRDEAERIQLFKSRPEMLFSGAATAAALGGAAAATMAPDTAEAAEKPAKPLTLSDTIIQAAHAPTPEPDKRDELQAALEAQVAKLTARLDKQDSEAKAKREAGSKKPKRKKRMKVTRNESGLIDTIDIDEDD